MWTVLGEKQLWQVILPDTNVCYDKSKMPTHFKYSRSTTSMSTIICLETLKQRFKTHLRYAQWPNFYQPPPSPGQCHATPSINLTKFYLQTIQVPSSFSFVSKKKPEDHSPGGQQPLNFQPSSFVNIVNILNVNITEYLNVNITENFQKFRHFSFFQHTERINKNHTLPSLVVQG